MLFQTWGAIMPTIFGLGTQKPFLLCSIYVLEGTVFISFKLALPMFDAFCRTYELVYLFYYFFLEYA